jgi:ABC-2 type transport system ATP-binding protein
MLDIGEIIKTPARNLSLGQRMKCEIASAFLHNPKTVFLDEPTIGLDAVSKLAVRDFVKQMNKENNTTIILTTHDTQDIDALTDRILLIGKGKILLDGKLDELKKRFKEKYVTIEYNGDSNFTLCDGLKFIDKKESTAKIVVDLDKMSLPKTMEYLSNLIEITDFDVSETPIDEIVVKMYKEYKI